MKYPALRIFPLLFAIPFWFGCGSASSRQALPDPRDNPALRALNDSIVQFPKQAPLFLRRAEWLTMNSAHEAAAEDYKRAWELDPREETALLYISALSVNGMVKEKMKLLEDCIHRFPSNPEFRRLYGDGLNETGRKSEALEWFDRMLHDNPGDFETWYEKGLLQLQLKDTAQAILSLRKAYELQPIHTYALELAHTYAEMGNPASVALCDEVAAQDSAGEWVDPYFIKGIYYSNTKQYNPALAAFDSAIRRDWTFADAYIEKGIVFFKQKNYDEALHTFRMAATVSNTNPDAYFWMGRCYEIINKKDEARINYERALALDRNFQEARDALKRLKSG